MKILLWSMAILSAHAFGNAGPIPERNIVSVQDAYPNMSVYPRNPMERYTPSSVSESRLYSIWNSMNAEMDGKDCYRRAHVWAYDMYEYFGVRSMKIFIHYTNKFNRELDGMADMKKRDLRNLIDYRTYRMLGYNKTWDYHVAPLVQLDNGEYRVLDKELILAYDAGFPYSQDAAWNLQKRPAKIEEWLDGLTIRGELLWQARKQRIRLDMNKARSRGRTAQYNTLLAKYRELGMDRYDQIDIKCKKADSIADVDLNHSNAYCFYTIAPMYYYNEIDLRAQAFGSSNMNYAIPVNNSVYTEQNFIDCRNRYTTTDWIYAELRDAAREIKRGSRDFRRRIERER